MKKLHIGVTGATGQIGSALINALSHRENISVCAFVRDIARAKNQLPKNVEMRKFDYLLPNEIFNGMNKIFWLVPHDKFPEKKWMEMLKYSNIENIVLLSSIHPEIFNLRKSEIFIEQMGISYTILRPNTFMQNFNTFSKKSITEKNAFYYPASTGKTSFIDIRDISEAAAIILLSDSHQNKIYTLTGEQSLNYFQAAEILSSVYGKTIRYVDTYNHPESDTENSEDIVWNNFFSGVRNNLFSDITTDLPMLLGHSPRTLVQYANDYWNKTLDVG